MCGLVVVSQFPLPLPAAPSDALPDVRVLTDRVDHPGPVTRWNDLGAHVGFSRTSRGPILELDGERFAIFEDQVVVDAPDPARAAVRWLEVVIGVLLSLRGTEPLHGSAAARSGSAIAFVGDSGSGKTTASLRLVDDGWSLLADDLLCLDDAGRVLPSAVSVNLCADAWPRAGATAAASGKRRYLVAGGGEPASLRALVVLDPAFEALTELTGHAPVEHLLRHFAHDFVIFPGQTVRRLDTTSAIAARVRCLGAPPRGLTAEALHTLAEWVARGGAVTAPGPANG